MKVLSLHEQIVARSIFPFEVRASQYYLACALEGQKNTSFIPIHFDDREYRPFLDRDIPSVTWSVNHLNDEIGTHGAALTESYYRFVADIENKPLAQYFAEKLVGFSLMSTLTEANPNARVIFLNRDPRDIFFSIKSFNQKRGFLRFGEEKGEESMFAGLISHQKNTKKFANSLGNRSIEIRYEDLIRFKSRTLSNILKFLELDSRDNEILRICKHSSEISNQVIHHKTTPDAITSIGRWKKDSDQKAIALFEKYRTDLIALGYE